MGFFFLRNAFNAARSLVNRYVRWFVFPLGERRFTPIFGGPIPERRRHSPWGAWLSFGTMRRYLEGRGSSLSELEGRQEIDHPDQQQKAGGNVSDTTFTGRPRPTQCLEICLKILSRIIKVGHQGREVSFLFHGNLSMTMRTRLRARGPVA
jgi:hypothetical protein